MERGSNIKLFILGLLHQGEAYGYQLQAGAKKWGVEDWAGFSQGSIYNALQRLRRQGLIVERGTTQHGSYAPATLYEITEAGRRQVLKMIADAAADVIVQDPFDLVTAFFGILTVEERRRLIALHCERLGERIRASEEEHAFMKVHTEAGAPTDWVLAAIEKSIEGDKLRFESCKGLLFRCDSWLPPEPLSTIAPESTDAGGENAGA
jgi:DNA-binding PadR family transcriptional regulator